MRCKKMDAIQGKHFSITDPEGVKTVIGIIDNTHYQLLDNCMLYTLITRAKKRCLLLAEPQAFLKCIRTSHNQRNTWLSLMKNKMGE